jgi:hypothetical protein
MHPQELLHEGERVAITIAAVSERALAYFLLGRAWASLGLNEPARRALHQATLLYQETERQKTERPEFSFPRKTLREIGHPVWLSEAREDGWKCDIVTLLVEVRDVAGALSFYDLYHDDDLLKKIERIQPGSTKRFPLEFAEQEESTDERIVRSREKPYHSEAHYARLLKRASTIHQRLRWACDCSGEGYFALARKQAVKITDPIVRAVFLHRVALNEWGQDRTYLDWKNADALGGVLPRATPPPPATAALFRQTFPVVKNCPSSYNWALMACGVQRLYDPDNETMALLEAAGMQTEMSALLQKLTFEVGDNCRFRYPRDLHDAVNGPIHDYVLWYRRLKDKTGLVQMLRKLQTAFLKVPPTDSQAWNGDYRMWHCLHLYLVGQARAGDRAGAEAFLEKLMQHYERTPFFRYKVTFNPYKEYHLQENGLLFSLLAVSVAQIGALERAHEVLEKALRITEPLEGVSPELLRAAGLANLAYGYARRIAPMWL